MANEKRLIALDDLLKFPIRIDHYDKEHGNADFVYGVETVLEYAENLPTADAVVHGRWLFDSGRERYFCSACNEEALYTTKDEPVYDYDWEENLRYSHTETFIEEHLTNYCPNCGAKMDGDGNEI